ncbi:MAG: hypothetical protein ABIP35_06755 [Ginsengibacter sp.]
MDENKFEKQVRQKMDELKIQPAESVWENVEKRIQKKDPRKRFVWLFAALFLGLMVGGFYLSVQNKHSANPNPDTQNIIDGNDVSSPGAKNDTKNSVREEGKKSTIDLAKNNGNIVKGNQDKLKESSKNNPAPRLIVMSKNYQYKKIIETESNDIIAALDDGETLKLSNGKSVNSTGVLENTLPAKELNIGQPAKNFEDSSLNILIEKRTEPEIVSNKSPTEVLKKSSKKWLLGFNFSVGKTQLGAGLLGIGGEKSLADMSLNSPGNSGGPITNPPVYKDPTPRNDLALIVGVSAQKKISKNTSLVLGINYKYFSTLNDVGSWLGYGNYYSNQFVTSSQSFLVHRNNFHFLEAPVLFKIETRQNKKLHLNVVVGAGLSRLLSSNSLQYQQGMFFNDNSFFNKTQIALEGGVSAILFSKKSYPVSIGPYVNYGLNNLTGKGLYGGKHLGFIGIRTEVFFKNKK